MAFVIRVFILSGLFFFFAVTGVIALSKSDF